MTTGLNMPRPVIKPHRSPRRRRLFFALVFVGLAVFFAPTFVAATGLFNRVLRSIIPPEAGALTAQSASIGWFSSIKLSGLEVRTHDGELLLAVPTLTLDRTILNLLVDRDNLGTVSVHEPTLHVDVDGAGSNLEEFVARYLQADRGPPRPISCEVDVRGGSVYVAGTVNGRKSDVAVDQLTFQMDGGELVALHAALSAAQDQPPEATAGSSAGALGIGLTRRADAARQLDVTAEDWPIDAASPWLMRWIDEARVSGRLTCEASTVWAAGSQDAALESSGAATLTDLEVQASVLADERLLLTEVQIPWEIRSHENRLSVDELSIKSEMGAISAQGEVPFPDGSSGTRAWMSAAMRAPLVATGALDVARVAAMLPGTLRIREGVRVTSGRAEFSLQSRPGDRMHHWTGSLTVRDLAADAAPERPWGPGTRGRRVLRWNHPVTVAASVRQDDHWAVDSFTCQSDFLQIAAQGDRQQLEAQVDFDLARLAAELDQFVDLEGWQLGGRGSLRAAWKPSAEGPLRATVHGSVHGLRFVDPGGRRFSESLLQLAADVVFTLPTEAEPLMLDRGSRVTVSTDKERLSVRLDTRSAWPLAAAQSWQGHAEAEGDLGRWAERLSPWIELDPWRVGGTAKISTPFEFGADAVQARALQVELANLQAIGPGWRVSEPLVTLETSGRYDFKESSLSIGDTKLIGSSVSLAARNTSLAWNDGPSPQYRGEATFRAALERIDAWRIGTDGRPLPIRPSGMVVGLVRVASQTDGPTAEVTATVSDLTIHEYLAAAPGRQAGYRPGWQEAKLELAAEVGYRNSADQWTIQEAVVRSNSLAAAVAGSVSDVTGTCEVNIRGSVDYDLADIGPVVAASLGWDMTMSGREQATFEVIGPLFSSDAAPAARMVATSGSNPGTRQAWSRRLQGHAAAGWESIHFFGLPIGRGRVAARLRDGRVAFAPLNVSVGPEGRLTASASARLAPPRELVVPAGAIITDVEITPEVADKLLKYFIPALAEAIQTQGKFSLATSGGRVPLDDPAAVESAGQLTVHSVRVRPGRMGREWILLAEQIEAVLKERRLPQLLTRARQDWLTIDEQVVDFRVENARVYHDNLVFHIGEVEVRSRGSVGFDQTLAIEIEVPIQDRWVAGRPFLAGFRGQTIKGTIRGTFGNIDRGTLLEDLLRQVAENAAAGAIEEGLNRALDRLLRPR